jgi:general secretion pathway protein G
MYMKKNQFKSGFSMIELLVVATIIIVISAIGMVSFRNAGIKSRNAARKADLEVVRQALTLYRADEGAYPVGSFDAIVSTLQGSDYLTEDEVVDPKGWSYVYTGSGCDVSSCTGFTLSATLEGDGVTTYEISN